MSIGSLYQYFPDKVAVYRAVVRRHAEEVKPLIIQSLSQMANPRNDLVDLTQALMRELARANARNPHLMSRIETELGWLEHENDDELDIVAIVRNVLSVRYDFPNQELDTIAQLMVLTVSHLSRWLVHGKPPELASEPFILATGSMLRALLPAKTSTEKRTRAEQNRKHQ